MDDEGKGREDGYAGARLEEKWRGEGRERGSGERRRGAGRALGHDITK